MVEERLEDTEPAPESGRSKRPPPTIELQATEVSGEAPDSGADAESKRSSHRFRREALSSIVIAAVSGACAGALVIGAMWLSGWPNVGTPPAAPAQSATNTAVVDDLAARLGRIESQVKNAPASDSAAAARLDGLDKAVSAVRDEITGLRAQSGDLAAAIKDLKSAPRESAASPELAEINRRIAGLESAIRAQGAEIAQENGKPADDVALRRMVTAALLETLVRTGEPYSEALAAAKSLAPTPDALKPLETFAATGVPSPAVLSRELLALIPKLSPPGPANQTTGSGLLERLEAGAAKLVRIERTNTVGNERGNVVARVTAAALRNDYSEARRELKTLAPADRVAAQSWIEKSDERDAALAASHQFVAAAMTTLAEPAQ
ncbi:MAG TPA: hypothetical protein VJV58_14460 [Bradyrhizobium sp.]|uniref:COG4223 family protein n=1 Tax=Bradyrhizobium sp. TaxID=376 RepID=UPI002B491A66|nr:hypothetical protein [Bradyrhizobium sp.]HKO72127.1 hypothetical protein [Bradyrhizobium sp.]